MVDRTPQQFGGVPDGSTDSTTAIQAAIDAWQPGDQVIISGGTFRTTGVLSIAQNGLVLKGDGRIQAKTPFGDSVLIQISATSVVLDTDGLELDQADVVGSGDSIRANNLSSTTSVEPHSTTSAGQCRAKVIRSEPRYFGRLRPTRCVEVLLISK